MRNLMFTIFILTAAGPVFSNGDIETFSEMTDSLLSGSVKLIEPSRLQEMMDSDSDIYIIDSRTADEYEVSRLRGSLFSNFESFTPEAFSEIPKTATVIVYCSVGYRSEKTAEKLLEAGYSRVFNLNGGIFRWVNEGRIIYNESGETTKVHGFSKEWGRWLESGDIIY